MIIFKRHQFAMRNILLFLLLAALVASARAQTINSSVTYTTEQGLSENVVYTLLQDKEGFIWAGTHHGLNRFDGYTWKNFYHSNYDSLSLPANVIYDIEQDGEFLWLSSTSGVIRFSTKTFHSKLIPVPGNSNLDGSFHMDRIDDSLIAVSFLNRVGLLNTHSGNISILKTGSKHNGINIGFNKFFHFGSRLYFAVENGSTESLFQIDLASGSIRPVDQNVLFPFKPIAPVLDYFTDDLNHHWAFYSTIGWRVYDHTGRPDEIKLADLPTTISTSAYIKHKEKVWLASNAGIICYNMNSRTFEITSNRDHNILVNKVYCMIMDRQQNIWAGTFGGGLSKLSTLNFGTNYGYANQPDILLGNMITGIRKLRSGDMLIYDFTNYEIRDAKFKKIESGSVSNDLKQFIRLGLDMDEKDARRLHQQLTQNAGKDDLVFTNAFKDSKGRIYHGSKIIETNGKTVLITRGNITKILDDRWGNTWVTSASGLYKILPDNSLRGIAFPRITKIPNFIFTDALITGDSILWLATQEGLIRMQLPTMTYLRFDVDDGLPDNYVYQIQCDQRGNIWLSTNKGLSCFDQNQKRFRNFGKRYGLINSEYNSFSAVKLNDTTLVFGGTAGVDFINPESLLSSSKQTPDILVTVVKINNRDTIPKKNMVVTHEMNNWEFNFTTNDFIFPQDIYFRYRLLGATEDWIYSRGNNKTVFSTLNPGSYNFEIQSSYNKNDWSQSANLPFQITRPFWQSWLFLLICTAIVASLVFWLFKYRLQQKVNMLNMRNRISRDLHDDVGSSLSGIRIFSQMAEEKIDTDPALTRSYLQKVQRYCEAVLGSMNDIVWTINPDNDRFIKIYRKLHSYAASVAEPYHVKVNFSEAGLLNDQKLNMQDRKNLYLIAKEAINNSIKYSGCKNLNVEIRKSRDRLVMVISDDGKGFDPSTVVNGNGLRNISERAEEMNAELNFNTSANGTSVRVSMRIP
jgi:ligand-binding sensor domain-containing protein